MIPSSLELEYQLEVSRACLLSYAELNNFAGKIMKAGPSAV